MTDRNDMATTEWHPAEGVRLIGADEAKRALDAGHATGRRGGSGSSTTSGPGARRLRFTEDGPVGTDDLDGGEPASLAEDDAEIDLTDGYQRSQAGADGLRSYRAMALTASPPAPPAPGRSSAPAARVISWGPPLPGDQGEQSGPPDPDDVSGGVGAAPVDRVEEQHADTDAFVYPRPAVSREDTTAPREPTVRRARITMSGGQDLPHWTEPGEDGATGLGSRPGGRESRPHVGSWARWRSDHRDWDDLDVGEDLFPDDDDEPRLGALDTDRSERSDLYSFDEAFRVLQAERLSGSHSTLSADDPVALSLTGEPRGGIPERPRRATSRRPLRPSGPTVASGTAAPGGATAASGAGGPGRLRRGADRLRRGGPDRSAGTVDEGGGGGAVAGASRARAGRVAGASSALRAGGAKGVSSALRMGRAKGESSAARVGPTEDVSSATRARRRRRDAAPRSDRSVLLSRILVGAALVVLLVVAFAIGPKALVVLAAVVVLLCAAEAYSMLQRSGFRPATLLGLTATGGLMFAAYWRGEPALPLVVVLAFAATMVWYLVGISDARPLANVAVTTMTILWVGVMGSFAALLLRVPNGKGLFLGAVVVTVVADIVAYFGGRRWGRHALAPKVSPGKTIEGFVAGAAAAVIAGMVFGEWVNPWGGLYHGLLLGVAVALFAPIGDLFESLIKRDLEVKDSGTVLAGHGGLLDRFDSLLLVLPATYYLADYLHLLR